MNITTTPEPFVPGGAATVTMIVHNEGPDTAGGVLQNEPYIVVYEKGYDIVTRPPPFIQPEPSVGCTAYAEESEYIPGLPDGGITLMFTYWFDAIPPGQSRTCTYRVQFLPSTHESFATYWLVSSYANDDDINPDNNRFDYTFIAAPAQASIPVPTLSAISSLILSAGVLLAVASTRKRRPSRS